MLSTTLTNLFGSLSIAGGFVLIICIILSCWRGAVGSIVRKSLYDYGLYAILIFTLSGVIGSLLYSEVVGLIPCQLCWWQRIFLYPQAIIAIVALWRRDRLVAPVFTTLSFLGMFVSLYQVYLQFHPTVSSFCTIGFSDCSKIDIQFMGFLTMPGMAALLFVWIIFISLFIVRRRVPVIE